MVFGFEHAELSQPRDITVTSAELGPIEASGFDADEDPVFGW